MIAFDWCLRFFLTLIYFILLTNKQVTFLYSQITCWLKTSPPPPLSSLTTTFASLLEQRLPKKLLRWWSVISTALSRIARTSKALTIGKKCTRCRVKVIFYTTFISNKPREVTHLAEFLIPRISYNRTDPAHTFFHWLFKLQSSWAQRKWSPHHSVDFPTWFQAPEHLICFWELGNLKFTFLSSSFVQGAISSQI